MVNDSRWVRQDNYKEYIINKNKDTLLNDPNYQEYRRMWFECPEKEIVPNFPINLDIHITNICNLKCPFCPRTWKDLAGEYQGKLGFMDMDLFKKIIDEAVAEGVKAVHFTGNGEPLLHRDLERMIKYAREKGVLEILMHTNATLLTKNRSEILLEAGIHRLVISFDSPTKQTYERLRVGANFEKTLNNIKRFVMLRNKKGYIYPFVRVQMVDQGANKDERNLFDALFSEIADSVSHVFYIPYNGGPNVHVPSDVINGNSMLIGKRRLVNKFKCKYLWQRLIVEWNGEVYPCFYNDKLLLGNAQEERIVNIWKGDRIQKLRLLHSKGLYNTNSECRECGRQYEIYEDNNK